MSFNLKTLRKATMLSMVSLLVGVAFGSVAIAYEHNAVPLKDASGQYISELSATGNAFSIVETCGGCHEYDMIEQHSYHSQVAANEHYGWNPMNPDGDTWESGPGPKGKAWVQGQGHLGAW